MSKPGAPPRAVAAELLNLATTIFQQCGMTGQDAALLADTLVASDLRGVHSHGVLRVPEYITKLTTDGVNPRGRPEIVVDAGACLVIDAKNSMGQIGTHFGMVQVLERAASTGIAAAAIRGSNHNGAMAYYAMQALPRAMIGLATTNALPVMAPWGGTERLLGINPLGVAIPAGEESPIVYDAAFSGTSHGKVRVYQQRGEPLPAGWAFDAAGQPTTDPAVAIEGLLAPIGGYKGTALAMIMGILSSMLSGAAYGTELGDLRTGPHPGQDGHFLIAINIAAFVDVAHFRTRVDTAIRQIHGGRMAPGIDRLYAPGEIEFANGRAYQRDGIPLNAATLADLKTAAGGLGLNLDQYEWL